MTKAKTFRVTYEHWSDGWWTVRVHGVQGVHSNGRTIDEARRRVREPLALAIGDRRARAAVFDEEVVLARFARDLIARAKTARAAAVEADHAAGELQRRAAKALTVRMGLSLRDAGELLEVSHVAVSKVLRRAPIAPLRKRSKRG